MTLTGLRKVNEGCGVLGTGATILSGRSVTYKLEDRYNFTRYFIVCMCVCVRECVVLDR